jgi:hypothetical protein
LCADLKKQSFPETWEAYRRAWRRPEVARALELAARDGSRLAEANRWVMLEKDLPAAPIQEIGRGGTYQEDWKGAVV